MSVFRDWTGARFADHARKWIAMVRRSLRQAGRVAPRRALAAKPAGARRRAALVPQVIDHGRVMRGRGSSAAYRAEMVARGDGRVWRQLPGQGARKGGASWMIGQFVGPSVVSGSGGVGRWRDRREVVKADRAGSARTYAKISGPWRRSGSISTVQDVMPARRAGAEIVHAAKRYGRVAFRDRRVTGAGPLSAGVGWSGATRRVAGAAWQVASGTLVRGRSFAPVSRGHSVRSDRSGDGGYVARFDGVDRVVERSRYGAVSAEVAQRNAWEARHRAGHADETAERIGAVPPAVSPPDMMRIMGEFFGDEARRPPSGVTGFDARMSPVFAGRKPGF